jgi:hypothetical protein
MEEIVCFDNQGHAYSIRVVDQLISAIAMTEIDGVARRMLARHDA